jgi:hypothetical protein
VVTTDVLNKARVSLRAASLALLVGACNADTPGQPAGPAELIRLSGDAQQTTVAMPVNPVVALRDAQGEPIVEALVTFRVTAGSGFVIPDTVRTDRLGIATTSWYMGPQPGTASLRVTHQNVATDFTATAGSFIDGGTYRGTSDYIELMAGTLPLIISAPHGGSLRPAGLPDRTDPNATTVRDTNTEELARQIYDTFMTRLGAAPTVIINRLHRAKIDTNREIEEATEGNPIAQRAWYEWHALISAARAQVVRTRGRGFYIDLHGHGHAIARLELGYMLTASQLAQSDAALNALVSTSSIRTLASNGPRTHAELLRGPTSLGTLFEAAGFPAVPSTTQRDPGAGNDYFNGGFNTGLYGSRGGGTIDGVQIEAHFTGVRDSDTSRRRFADALVDVMSAYFVQNYNMPLAGSTPPMLIAR